MSPAVARLEKYLQSTLDLKSPGITGFTVKCIAELCTSNIKEEHDLIQKISDHFESAPATHKLGVLYVIDFIARRWIALTRKLGRHPPNAAPDGTFAGGVDRITKLLPALMTDIVNHAPLDHKGKIQKLLNIWEDQKSFPPCMLVSFRRKFDAFSSNNRDQELADVVDPDIVTHAFPTDPPPIQPLAPIVHSPSMSHLMTDNCTGADATGSLAVPVGCVLQTAPAPQPSSQRPKSYSWTTIPPLSPTANPKTKQTAVMGQPALLQLLSQWDIMQNQRAAMVASTTEAGYTAQPVQLPGSGSSSGKDTVGSNPAHWQHPGKYKSEKQRHYRHCRPKRRPSQSFQGSRYYVAPRARRHRTPVNPRNNGYPSGCQGDRSDTRKEWVNEPLVPSFSNSSSHPSSPQPKSHLAHRGQPKSVKWDYSICPGNIKVLSRTLFIMGGFSEELLRSRIEKFGAIQTCIVDKLKSHAFVKMISRKDALIAHRGIGSFCSDEMPFRVKWGIGFGPRDCCDYKNGISIIPIKRLTLADCKWLRTAECGGTGDLPIQERMVVEEPDIELGTGISSKAISRRIEAHTIGKRPRSGQAGRGRRRGRY